MTRIDPLQETLDVIRLPHPCGFRSISVALPFGVSRTVSATEKKPRRWISENRIIVGDEQAVIQALANKLTSEILAAEASRS
jgi:hypothetical protein